MAGNEPACGDAGGLRGQWSSGDRGDQGRSRVPFSRRGYVRRGVARGGPPGPSNSAPRLDLVGEDGAESVLPRIQGIARSLREQSAGLRSRLDVALTSLDQSLDGQGDSVPEEQSSEPDGRGGQAYVSQSATTHTGDGGEGAGEVRVKALQPSIESGEAANSTEEPPEKEVACLPTPEECERDSRTQSESEEGIPADIPLSKPIAGDSDQEGPGEFGAGLSGREREGNYHHLEAVSMGWAFKLLGIKMDLVAGIDNNYGAGNEGDPNELKSKLAAVGFIMSTKRAQAFRAIRTLKSRYKELTVQIGSRMPPPDIVSAKTALPQQGIRWLPGPTTKMKSKNKHAHAVLPRGRHPAHPQSGDDAWEGSDFKMTLMQNLLGKTFLKMYFALWHQMTLSFIDLGRLLSAINLKEKEDLLRRSLGAFVNLLVILRSKQQAADAHFEDCVYSKVAHGLRKWGVHAAKSLASRLNMVQAVGMNQQKLLSSSLAHWRLYCANYQRNLLHEDVVAKWTGMSLKVVAFYGWLNRYLRTKAMKKRMSSRRAGKNPVEMPPQRLPEAIPVSAVLGAFKRGLGPQRRVLTALAKRRRHLRKMRRFTVTAADIDWIASQTSGSSSAFRQVHLSSLKKSTEAHFLETEVPGNRKQIRVAPRRLRLLEEVSGDRPMTHTPSFAEPVIGRNESPEISERHLKGRLHETQVQGSLVREERTIAAPGRLTEMLPAEFTHQKTQSGSGNVLHTIELEQNAVVPKTAEHQFLPEGEQTLLPQPLKPSESGAASNSPTGRPAMILTGTDKNGSGKRAPTDLSPTRTDLQSCLSERSGSGSEARSGGAAAVDAALLQADATPTRADLQSRLSERSGSGSEARSGGAVSAGATHSATGQSRPVLHEAESENVLRPKESRAEISAHHQIERRQSNYSRQEFGPQMSNLGEALPHAQDVPSIEDLFGTSTNMGAENDALQKVEGPDVLLEIQKGDPGPIQGSHRGFKMDDTSAGWDIQVKIPRGSGDSVRQVQKRLPREAKKVQLAHRTWRPSESPERYDQTPEYSDSGSSSEESLVNESRILDWEWPSSINEVAAVFCNTSVAREGLSAFVNATEEARRHWDIASEYSRSTTLSKYVIGWYQHIAGLNHLVIMHRRETVATKTFDGWCKAVQAQKRISVAYLVLSRSQSGLIGKDYFNVWRGRFKSRLRMKKALLLFCEKKNRRFARKVFIGWKRAVAYNSGLVQKVCFGLKAIMRWRSESCFQKWCTVVSNRALLRRVFHGALERWESRLQRGPYHADYWAMSRSLQKWRTYCRMKCLQRDRLVLESTADVFRRHNLLRIGLRVFHWGIYSKQVAAYERRVMSASFHRWRPVLRMNRLQEARGKVVASCGLRTEYQYARQALMRKVLCALKRLCIAGCWAPRHLYKTRLLKASFFNLLRYTCESDILQGRWKKLCLSLVRNARMASRQALVAKRNAAIRASYQVSRFSDLWTQRIGFNAWLMHVVLKNKARSHRDFALLRSLLSAWKKVAISSLCSKTVSDLVQSERELRVLKSLSAESGKPFQHAELAAELLDRPALLHYDLRLKIRAMASWKIYVHFANLVLKSSRQNLLATTPGEPLEFPIAHRFALDQYSRELCSYSSVRQEVEPVRERGGGARVTTYYRSTHPPLIHSVKKHAAPRTLSGTRLEEPIVRSKMVTFEEETSARNFVEPQVVRTLLELRREKEVSEKVLGMWGREDMGDLMFPHVLTAVKGSESPSRQRAPTDHGIYDY